MSNLVFIENNRVVTDSLMVSEAFEKEHKNVKRDVRELGCSAAFYTLNFERNEYTDGRGRTQEKYLMTQDGFTLLVMGYTGQQAMQFKEKYIMEFNRMKEEMNGPKILSEREQLIASMRLTLETSEELSTVKQDIVQLKEQVNNKMTLDYYQQGAVSNAKKTRVEYLWRNGEYSLEIHDTKKKLHAQAWTDIKRVFGVASYRDIRQSHFEEAMNYIKSWRPRLI